MTKEAIKSFRYLEPVAPPVTESRVQRVDTLRFICAICVLLSHVPIPYRDFLGPTAKFLLSPFLFSLTNGPAAVIIFFVISGFSIHWPYRNGAPLSLVSFLTARLLRIGLPLLASLGLNRILDCPNSTVYRLIYWSLFAEIFYYLTYPVVLKAIRKFGWGPVYALSVAGAAAVYAGDGYQQYTFHASGVSTTWLLGWPAWLIGVKLAADFGSLPLHPKRRLNFYRFTMFTAASATLVLNFHTPLRYGFTLNLVAVLAYFWLSCELVQPKENRIYPWLEKSGAWSYSLYLVHVAVWKRMDAVNLSPAFKYLATVTLSLVVGYLFYRVAERPAHRFARYVSRRLAKVTAGSGEFRRN